MWQVLKTCNWPNVASLGANEKTHMGYFKNKNDTQNLPHFKYGGHQKNSEKTPPLYVKCKNDVPVTNISQHFV
jgi:hypothetical protein